MAKKKGAKRSSFPTGSYDGYIITGVESIEIRRAKTSNNKITLSIDTDSDPEYYLISYSFNNLDSTMQTYFNQNRISFALAKRDDSYHSGYWGASTSDGVHNDSSGRHNARYMERYKWHTYNFIQNQYNGTFYLSKHDDMFISPMETFEYTHGGDVFKHNTLNIRVRVILWKDVPHQIHKIVDDHQDEIVFHCTFRKRPAEDICNYGADAKWEELE